MYSIIKYIDSVMFSIIISINIRFILNTGNSGITKQRLKPKTIAPIVLCQIATETGWSELPNFLNMIERIAPLTPLANAR